MMRQISLSAFATCLVLVSPQPAAGQAPSLDASLAADPPTTLKRISVQTAVGLAASTDVPIALLTTTQVIGTMVVKWDLPLSYAAAGAFALSAGALTVPGVAVDRVGSRMGTDAHTLATIAGGLAGYTVTALANASYWTPGDLRVSTPLMLGSWLVPGITTVLAYQIAEWLD